MIKVYEASEKIFDNNGLKILNPLKAKVHKEDNGDYYLEVEDTIDNLEYYQQGYILRVRTPWGWQGFRCSNPIKKNKKVSCKAWHLFYDSANYVIEDTFVVDKDCNAALDQLNSKCDTTTPFTTISDITTINSFRCVRKSFEEAVNTVLERWGGHLDRDNWNIGVRYSIGQDRGVTLAYGKNITNIEAKEDWSNVVTKLMPVGKDGLLLDEPWLIADIAYDIPYTKVVSFDQDIDKDDYSTEEDYIAALKMDLQAQAMAYLNENKVPKINYTLAAHLQDIADVGDTIHVKHPRCNIDILTNVIAVEWDCIAERYTSIEFGNFRPKLKNLLTEANKKAEETAKAITQVTETKLSQSLLEATSKILGIMSNSYAIYDGDQTIYVDKLPKEEAKNCMRINSEGIGFSNTGFYGPFNSAWTIDGTLDMQAINVINLTASLIKGGVLKLGGENNVNGAAEIYDANNNLIGSIGKEGFEYSAETIIVAPAVSTETLCGTDIYCGYKPSDPSKITPNTIAEKLAAVLFKADNANNEVISKVSKGDYETFVRQTAEAISQKVSKGDVVSEINQTAEGVKIAANKISLEGAVTITGKFAVDENGAMTATGGKIAGFTITNDSLSCNINEDYSSLTETDKNKVKDYILDQGILTDEEKEKYNISGSYTISALDLLAIQRILTGEDSNYSKSKMSINLDSAGNAILIEGLSGYKSGWKTRIGVGGVGGHYINAEKQFFCDNRPGYNGIVTIGNTILTITGGIITDVTQS